MGRRQLGLASELQRRFDVLGVIEFRRLHQAGHGGRRKVHPLSLRHGKRARIGAHDHDDGNADAVEPGHVGDPRYPHPGHVRAHPRGHVFAVGSRADWIRPRTGVGWAMADERHKPVMRFQSRRQRYCPCRAAAFRHSRRGHGLPGQAGAGIAPIRRGYACVSAIGRPALPARAMIGLKCVVVGTIGAIAAMAPCNVFGRQHADHQAGKPRRIGGRCRCAVDDRRGSDSRSRRRGRCDVSAECAIRCRADSTAVADDIRRSRRHSGPTDCSNRRQKPGPRRSPGTNGCKGEGQTLERHGVSGEQALELD